MKVIGLTGGIGMGKSTVAAMFRRHGVPVFDADRTVRALQAKGGAAIPRIDQAFPGIVTDGALDRAALRSRIFADPAAKRRLEAIIHPLVRAAEHRFIASARRNHRRAVLLDIPLLFETRGEGRVDLAITVSAPRAVQIARVRKRGLAESDIAAIIARQMPDREKRRRADVVISTGLSRHHTLRAVRRLLHRLRTMPCPAVACPTPPGAGIGGR